LARLAETSRRVEVMKDEFLATVSHELRTPLTSIRGALGLMGAGVMGELPPEALEAAQLGHRNATRLARLVDDLLDLQALRRLELPWNAERLALGPMMEAAAAESAHFASDIEVRAWPAPADLWVVADPVRIRQVLDNLISNAVKFSPPKGRVQVRALRSDTGIRIEVEDAGPGIPDALQDTLFEPFTKGDASHTSSVKGTGLGLHISQSLVHRAGGSIGHRPAAQQGTVFWFELTAAAEV
jgi:signal transduction histidine kinase